MFFVKILGIKDVVADILTSTTNPKKLDNLTTIADFKHEFDLAVGKTLAGLSDETKAMDLLKKMGDYNQYSKGSIGETFAYETIIKKVIASGISEADARLRFVRHTRIDLPKSGGFNNDQHIITDIVDTHTGEIFEIKTISSAENTSVAQMQDNGKLIELFKKGNVDVEDAVTDAGLSSISKITYIVLPGGSQIDDAALEVIRKGVEVRIGDHINGVIKESKLLNQISF